MTFDFTLDKYTQLCRIIQLLECPVMPVRDFIKAGQPEGLSVILRHDVDRQMDSALRLAALEAKFGMRSTYYVRKQPTVFKPEALKRLVALGHEVGFHYETLSKTNGDTEKAIRLFEEELNCFRDIVPVSTISMHGSPLSPWNNIDLWFTHSFADYEVIGDAVLTISGESLYYFTDTGRSWNANQFNLRDHICSKKTPRQICTTDDLFIFLREKPAYPIYINAHPNRWAENWLNWGMGTVSDWAINQAKWVISLTRLQRN